MRLLPKLLIYVPAALSGMLLGTVVLSIAFMSILQVDFVWTYSILAMITGLSYTYLAHYFKETLRR